jgi:hypothetical protein
MRRLIRRFRSTSPMIEPEKSILDEYVTVVPSGGGLPLDAQRKIAAFALRMFAVAQYTHPTTRPIPRTHREHLVTHRSSDDRGTEPVAPVSQPASRSGPPHTRPNL